jgi:hypothetical protein
MYVIHSIIDNLEKENDEMKKIFMDISCHRKLLFSMAKVYVTVMRL